MFKPLRFNELLRAGLAAIEGALDTAEMADPEAPGKASAKKVATARKEVKDTGSRSATGRGEKENGSRKASDKDEKEAVVRKAAVKEAEAKKGNGTTKVAEAKAGKGAAKEEVRVSKKEEQNGTNGPVTRKPVPRKNRNNDLDRDGISDAEDKDDDNDGIVDVRDEDDDNDGVKDKADHDDDNDGTRDTQEQVHATTLNVALIEMTPPHPPREDTPIYQRTHRQLIHVKDTPCAICGVQASTIDKPRENPFGAKQMETHHYPVARSLLYACDEKRVAAFFPQVKDFESFEAFVDSEENMMVLCDIHHRHPLFGIHNLLAQDFFIQSFLFTGYQVVADAESVEKIRTNNERILRKKGRLVEA